MTSPSSAFEHPNLVLPEAPTNNAPPRQRSRTFRRSVAAMLAASLLIAACGSDDDSAGGVDTGGSAGGAASGASLAGAVQVTLADYEFRGIPKSIEAGSPITVTNVSSKELHEFVAFQLSDDEKRSATDLAKLPESELEELLSGPPAVVLLAAPGEDQIVAVGDGTLSDPGRYLVMCFIPTGADPQAYMDAAGDSGDGPPEVDGGPPHFVNGMVGELTVS